MSKTPILCGLKDEGTCALMQIRPGDGIESYQRSPRPSSLLLFGHLLLEILDVDGRLYGRRKPTSNIHLVGKYSFESVFLLEANVKNRTCSITESDDDQITGWTFQGRSHDYFNVLAFHGMNIISSS